MRELIIRSPAADSINVNVVLPSSVTLHSICEWTVMRPTVTVDVQTAEDRSLTSDSLSSSALLCSISSHTPGVGKVFVGRGGRLKLKAKTTLTTTITKKSPPYLSVITKPLRQGDLITQTQPANVDGRGTAERETEAESEQASSGG